MPPRRQDAEHDHKTRLRSARILVASGQITARFLSETDFDMDYLASLFMHDVDRYRMLSFENFGLAVNILPAPNAAPKLNPGGTFIGYQRYQITTYRDSASPKPMRIRISPRTDEVTLHFLCDWRPVREFMQHIKLTTEDSELNTPNGQFNRQWNWWMKNGKKFRIFDLPIEVRELIYGFVFGPRIEPFPTSKARRRGQRDAPIAALQPAAALLSLSRQVRAEASNICFSHTTFYLDHFDILRDFLFHFKSCNPIRRLQLSLSHYDFLRFFAYPLPGEDRQPKAFTVSILRSMTLNALELNIAPPTLITESHALDGACQKVVVEWILEAALPYVGTHPVKLTGFVKSKQKATFEAACRAARKQFDDWNQITVAAGLPLGTKREYGKWLDEYLAEEDGGVSLVKCESAEHPDTATAKPEELPPKCHCKQLCSEETWTSER